MKKIFKILTVALMTLTILTSCKNSQGLDEARVNFVSFEATSFDFGVDQGSNNTREITVFSSKVAKSEQTIQIEVVSDETDADPASYTIPTSVIIPAGSNVGVITINIADLNIGDAGKTIVLKFTPAEGRFAGDNIVLNVFRVCPLNDVRFEITFDPWPEEIYWRLRNSNGDYIGASSATPGYGGYTGLTGTLNEKFCIPDDTYTFDIFDQYGDGAGAVSLKLEDGTVLFESDGTYGSGTSATFTLPL